MSILTTEYCDEQLASDYTVPAGFDPLPFNPTYYGRFDTKAFQDLGQMTPAVLYGDPVRQLRDVRELHGGSAFPYLHWDTLGTAPILSPQASNWGGSYFGIRAMQLAGLTGVASNNFTAFLVCVPSFDYPNNFTTNGLFNVGDSLTTGVFVGGVAFGNDNRIGLFTFSNDAGTARPTLSLSSAMDVVSIQSTPSGITFGTAMGEISGVAASTTGTIQNGTVGDDSRLTGNSSFATMVALLVWSPALSPTDYSTVRAGLLGNVVLGSLWPNAWPLRIEIGDSLTIGVQVCPVTAAQSWPYQALALIGGNQGRVIVAKSGMRVDQMDAAYSADVIKHLSSINRPAKILTTILGGTNDLANGDSAANILARLQTLGTKLKTAGGKVNIGTIYANNGLSSPQNTQRLALNTSLLAACSVPSGFTRVYVPPSALPWVDSVTDWASNPNLTNASNVTYFNDGTHNTPAGYLAVATDWQGAPSATST